MTNGNQTSQSQSQQSHQNQSVQVLIQGSSDPALERRIFTEIASAGRQLARLSDVLEVLIKAHERSVGEADRQALEAIRQFRQMRGRIEQEKDARSSERIVEALNNLKLEDARQFDIVLARLRAWIDEQSAPALRTPD